MSRLLTVLLVLLSFGAAASDPCEVLTGEAARALDTRDTASLQRLHFRMSESAVCPAEVRARLAHNLALLLTAEAEAAQQAGGDPEPLLRRALRYGEPWQALYLLGRVEHQRKAYAEATGHYQAALDALDDPTRTPTPPDPTVIERVFTLAAETRQLAAAASDEASAYVAATTTRAGPGGLARPSVRGFRPVAVPIPVRFAFDSARLLPVGHAAAQDMFDYLSREGQPDILLVGHTDPTGRESYNRNLSQRRAAAVRDFLYQRGYRGRIEITGAGETQPPRLDNPALYTGRERNALARRVELVRRGGY